MHSVDLTISLILDNSVSISFFRQTINNANWKSVEYAVKRLSEITGKHLVIITGTHEILELKNSLNNMVPITLENGRLPVPKYIWKLVYDPVCSTGIVLVVLNNPFSTSYIGIEFCHNICDNYGWGKRAWREFDKGYIFCCKVSDFQNTVRTHSNIHVRGVLRGPPLEMNQEGTADTCSFALEN